MLQHSCRWHFAPNGPLERERRLLAFADSVPPTGGARDPNAPVDPNAANVSPEASAQGALEQRRIAEGQNVVADGIRNAVEGLGGGGAPKNPINTEKEEAARLEKLDKDKLEREAMQQRMNGKMLKELRAVSDKAGAISAEMQKIIGEMEDPELMRKLETMADPALFAQWKEDIDFLKLEQAYSNRDQLFAEDLQKFWTGGYSPDELVAAFRAFSTRLPYGIGRDPKDPMNGDGLGETVANLIDDQFGDGMAKYDWDALNQSVKYETIQEIRKGMNLDEWIVNTQERQTIVEGLLKEQQKKVDAVSDAADKGDEVPSDDSEGIGSIMGSLRFFSVMDYVRGIGRYWEAVKSTWDQRGKRYSATIAAKIGKTLHDLPFYGTEIHTTLDGELEQSRNEEANHMKEHMQHVKANWHLCFGKNGEFWEHMNNQNKALGILDYAAEHGWLYELDDDITSKEYPIMRNPHTGRQVNLTDICRDWMGAGERNKVENYFSDLRIKNAKGRETEMEDGYRKEHDTEEIPRFIKLIEGELDDGNLWTAAGIAKRAMERGLIGETAPWLLTTILGKLKNDPALRQAASVSFFDIIGKLSMYTTAFTLGWTKKYRKDLRKWCLTGDEDFIENTQLRQLNVIEQDIIAKDPKTDYSQPDNKEKLQRMVAKVLAAQTLKLPGGSISIFESRFSDYRKDARETFVDFADVFKEDADYFIERTEQPMLNQIGFQQILVYNSTFDFKDASRVSAFLEKLINIARELKRLPDQDAYTNYMNETKQKLNRHFESYLSETRAVRQLQTTLHDQETPAIAALVAEGLVDISVMKRAAYAPNLFEQLRTNMDFAPFYEKNNLAEIEQELAAKGAKKVKGGGGSD